jgi:hypothetical protein
MYRLHEQTKNTKSLQILAEGAESTSEVTGLQTRMKTVMFHSPNR